MVILPASQRFTLKASAITALTNQCFGDSHPKTISMNIGKHRYQFWLKTMVFSWHRLTSQSLCLLQTTDTRIQRSDNEHSKPVWGFLVLPSQEPVGWLYTWPTYRKSGPGSILAPKWTCKGHICSSNVRQSMQSP